MAIRIITGVLLVAALAAALSMGGLVFSVSYMLTICIAMFEMYRALGQAGHRPVQWPAWLCLVLSIPLFHYIGSVTLLLPLVAGAAMMMAAFIMFRSQPRLEDLLVSIMPLGCVLLPGMCMLGLQNAPDRKTQLMLTILAFGIPLFGDTTAYFVGKAYGYGKLCPSVSPNKTIEGAGAGLLGSILFSVITWGVFSLFGHTSPFWHSLVLGVIGGIAGQLGDLFASLVKRHCGVKDYGNIFPGHGGMMDRLDSVYWSTVVMYIYLNIAIVPLR